MNETNILETLGNVTPEDMAQAAIGAKLFWAGIDVAIAACIYILVCKVPWVSKWVFEYDDELDDQAAALKSGKMTAPTERGMTTQALAEIKAKKILGLMLVMAAALIE